MLDPASQVSWPVSFQWRSTWISVEFDPVLLFLMANTSRFEATLNAHIAKR